MIRIGLILALIFATNAWGSELLKVAPNKPEHRATGGFDPDLRILTEFGTFTHTVKKSEIEELLWKHSKRVTKFQRLKDSILRLAQDKYVFEALRTFLEEGGKLWAGERGGHYRAIPFPDDPDQSLIIMVGAKVNDDGSEISENEIDTTLAHELLHWVFDKMDCDISENTDTGGTDHHLISVLSIRVSFISMVREGKSLLERNFLNAIEKIGHYNLTTAIKAGDIIAVQEFLSDATWSEKYAEFAVEHIRLLQNQTKLNQEYARYQFSEAQLQEFRILWLKTAELLRYGLKTAVELRGEKPLIKVFSDADFQQAFFQGLPERL